MAAAGITVPIYASSTPDQAAHVLRDAGVTALFIDTSAQLDKIVAMRTPVPSLKHLVMMVDSPPGDGTILTLAELVRRGREAAELDSVLDERLQGLTPEHEATYVYTSGTTGPPKGVVQTHGNHLFMMESCGVITGLVRDTCTCFSCRWRILSRASSASSLSTGGWDDRLRGKLRRVGARPA